MPLAKISNPSGTVLIETHTTGQAIYLKPDGTGSNTGYIACSTTDTTINADLNITTGNEYRINSTKVLDSTSLGSAVVSSNLTSTGALDSGSITSNFGSINIGTSTLDCGVITAVGYLSSDIASAGTAVVGNFTNSSAADNNQNWINVGTNNSGGQSAYFLWNHHTSVDNSRYWEIGVRGIVSSIQGFYDGSVKIQGGTLITQHTVPVTDSTYDLGSGALRFNGIYGKYLDIDGNLTVLDGAATNTVLILRSNSDAAGFDFVVGGSGNLLCQDSGTGTIWQSTSGGVLEVGRGFLPINDNNISCGNGSRRFTDVFAVSGSVNSSDLRLKKDINPLPQALGLAFIEKLRPVNYQWTDKENGRTHQGFIAQEVSQTLTDLGMDPSEIALYIDGSIETEKEEIRKKTCFDKKQILCEEKYNEKRLKIYLEEQERIKQGNEEYVIPEYIEEEPYVVQEYKKKGGNPYQIG